MARRTSGPSRRGRGTGSTGSRPARGPASAGVNLMNLHIGMCRQVNQYVKVAFYFFALFFTILGVKFYLYIVWITICICPKFYYKNLSEILL
jgi:hypothetical protein